MDFLGNGLGFGFGSVRGEAGRMNDGSAPSWLSVVIALR